MKSHLKRLAMPKTWDLARKKTIFIVRPKPGRMNKSLSIPLQLLLRDMLKVAKTAKEARFILQTKEVIINGKRVRDEKHPVAFLDVLCIPELKKCWRILLSRKGKLVAHEIGPGEAKFRLARIRNKTLMKKGRIQLNLTDGTNILVDKDEYTPYDSISVDLKSGKITSHLKFEKNSIVYLRGGSHVGEKGFVENVRGKTIVIKSEKGDVYETSKKYAVVIGKDKETISLPE